MQPNKPNWDEFHDPEIVDWKLIREAIAHENTLTNYRLMWFVLSQGLLFTAFTSSSKQHAIQVVIAFVGIAVCVYLGFHLHAGQNQHNELRDWWKENYKDSKYPAICGDKFDLLTKKFPPYLFTAIFGLAWFILLFVI